MIVSCFTFRVIQHETYNMKTETEIELWKNLM
jgi:hypothetical protein